MTEGWRLLIPPNCTITQNYPLVTHTQPSLFRGTDWMSLHFTNSISPIHYYHARILHSFLHYNSLLSTVHGHSIWCVFYSLDKLTCITLWWGTVVGSAQGGRVFGAFRYWEESECKEWTEKETLYLGKKEYQKQKTRALFGGQWTRRLAENECVPRILNNKHGTQCEDLCKYPTKKEWKRYVTWKE